jgi:hypothetical protein
MGMCILKIAYCVNNNGEKIHISACDTKCNKYFGRLLCPLCGEQVDWINGQIQEKHFRHHHGSYMQDCENYCTSISNNLNIQPYAIEGLPLYLIKEFETYFLAIGLYGLEETTIQEAEEMDLEIEINLNIDSKRSMKVNFQHFVPNELEFVKLYSVNQQYCIKFNQRNLPSEIKKKWCKDINGIGINGAVFYYGECGGKKVSSDVGIRINEFYLLLTRDKIELKKIQSISFELLQELDFGWLKNYKIYKLRIKEINNETIDFCNRFDMTLSYLKPELVPLWPPCIKLEQELIYINECTKYFVLNNDDASRCDVFSYKLQSKLQSEKINDKKSIISSCIKSNDFISITNSHRQFTFSLVERINKKKLNLTNVSVEQSGKNFKINTKTKIFANCFKKELLIRSTILKSDSIELSIKTNEKIDLVYGTDIICCLQEQKKMFSGNSNEILDTELLQKIRMCDGEMIKTPDNFKWQILKFKKYSDSYKELNIHRKNNKISDKLLKLLRKY